MSKSARSKDHPVWIRIKMIANSRAHRAMQKEFLHLNSHVCPQVDDKFALAEEGKMSLCALRAWLGQVHTDYVSALEKAHEKNIKLRIRLREAERKTNVPARAIQDYTDTSIEA